MQLCHLHIIVYTRYGVFPFYTYNYVATQAKSRSSSIMSFFCYLIGRSSFWDMDRFTLLSFLPHCCRGTVYSAGCTIFSLCTPTLYFPCVHRENLVWGHTKFPLDRLRWLALLRGNLVYATKFSLYGGV